MYVNVLLNIHFKHLNRDISGIFSCRAQFTSFSLDQMWHRSSLIEKKPYPKLNKRVPCSDHMFHCPLASTGCTSQREQHPRTNASRSQYFNFHRVQDLFIQQSFGNIFSLPNVVSTNFQCSDGQCFRVGVAKRVDKRIRASAFFCYSVFITATS